MDECKVLKMQKKQQKLKVWYSTVNAQRNIKLCMIYN